MILQSILLYYIVLYYIWCTGFICVCKYLPLESRPIVLYKRIHFLTWWVSLLWHLVHNLIIFYFVMWCYAMWYYPQLFLIVTAKTGTGARAGARGKIVIVICYTALYITIILYWVYWFHIYMHVIASRQEANCIV